MTDLKKCNLVVTDIEMPKMDGHHLTKRIKEHPQLNKLPVIIFSSLITDELRHKGKGVRCRCSGEQTGNYRINSIN